MADRFQLAGHGGQALATPLHITHHAGLKTCRHLGNAGGRLGNRLLHRLEAQTAGGMGERGLTVAHILPTGPTQTFIELVEALHFGFEALAWMHQPACHAFKLQLQPLHMTTGGTVEAAFGITQGIDQVAANRHGHFRSRRRGRCTLVTGKINQGGIGLVTHSRDKRDRARRRCPDNILLVEGHEIFEAATATGNDNQVRSRHLATAFRQGIKTVDRCRHLFCRTRTLHHGRPEQHMARETVLQPVQNIPDHRTGGRGHHPDYRRQERDRLFPLGIEQPFGCELAFALLEHLQECALTGHLHRLDNDLILGSPRICRQATGTDDLQPLFRPDAQLAGRTAPADTIDYRLIILQGHVDMTGCGLLGLADFAANPHKTIGILNRAFQGVAELTHTENRHIAAGFRALGIGRRACERT